MRSYRVYLVNTSDDGVIGVYTTKKKAVAAAERYVDWAAGTEQTDTTYSYEMTTEDGKWRGTVYQNQGVSAEAYVEWVK